MCFEKITGTETVLQHKREESRGRQNRALDFLDTTKPTAFIYAF